MSDSVTNEYLMNIIKENTHDVNGKGTFALNGVTPIKAEPIANPATAMQNQATLRPQGSAASMMSRQAAEQGEDEEDEMEDMKEAIAFEASLRSLLSEVNVSEDFFVQAKTLFEAAVDTKLKAVAEEIAPALQEQFESKVGEITVALTEKIDDYLDYVVEEWMQENRLSVENGIKSTLAENFILGLKKLFEMHYVDVPAEKYNVLDGLYEQSNQLQTDLNVVIHDNMKLKKDLLIAECAGIFVNETKDLADTQTEKLASLIENIEFGSVDEYKTKLLTLKEHYLGQRVVIPEAPAPEITFSSVPSAPTTLVESYANTLNRLAKKL